MDVIDLANWRQRLLKWGLTDLADWGLEVFAPLAPLASQLLWVAQPTLGLVLPPERVTVWANLLDDPQGINWIREQLTND